MERRVGFVGTKGFTSAAIDFPKPESDAEKRFQDLVKKTHERNARKSGHGRICGRSDTRGAGGVGRGAKGAPEKGIIFWRE